MNPPHRTKDGVTITVVFHSVLLRKEHGIFMKEVLADYVQACLAPHFSRTILVAPVAEGVSNPFQTFRIGPGAIELALLPILERKVGYSILQRVTAYLSMLFKAVRAGDLVWIFLPCDRGLLAAVFCWCLRRPYIAYVGGDLVEMSQGKRSIIAWLRVNAERWAVRRAEFVLVAGNKLFARYCHVNPRTYERRPATRLRRGDILWRVDSFGNSPEPIRCLYVGSVSKSKGIPELLKAVADLRQSGKSITLTVVGAMVADQESELKELIVQLKLDRLVRLTGYVPNGPQLWEFFRQANVFILPSHGEGFPRVLYEAMAHGLPIVATPVGGITGEMRHEVNCLLVPVGSSVAIAKAIERICDEPGLRKRLISNAYRAVEKVLEVTAAQQVSELFLSLEL